MPPTLHRPDNRAIAAQLGEAADRLAAQNASEFRVHAYREAAQTLERWPEPLVDLYDREGLPGLVAVPTIGRTIACAIEELAWRGRWALLDRLRGDAAPEALFMTLPGVGEQLAARFHHELGVETLEALEVASQDGRLAAMRGVGPRRVQALRDLLAAQLGRASSHTPIQGPPPPTVDLLLRLDGEYRMQASAGVLPTIDPPHTDPSRLAPLPIWHVDEAGYHLTLLYSASRRAHELDKTRDWIVIHWDRDGEMGHATVVTEYRGALRGRRVVRGRERECMSFWARETEARARTSKRRLRSTGMRAIPR